MGYQKVAPRDCLGCGIRIVGRGGAAVRCIECTRAHKAAKQRARKRRPRTEEQKRRQRELDRGRKRIRTPEQAARQKAAVAAWKAAHRGYKSTGQRIKAEFRKHLHAGYRLHPCFQCGELCDPGRVSGDRCSECLHAERSEKRRLDAWVRRRGRAVICPTCKAAFCWMRGTEAEPVGKQDFCSEQCRRKKLRMERKLRKKKFRDENGKYIAAEDIHARYKWKCAACERDVRDGSPHVDHIWPVAKGGHSIITNLQTLCSTCNSDKRDRHPIEFMAARFGESAMCRWLTNYMERYGRKANDGEVLSCWVPWE